jgi:hypothetical protein
MDIIEMKNNYQDYVKSALNNLQDALREYNDASAACTAAWTYDERQHTFEVRMQSHLNVRAQRLIFTRAENKARESYLAYVKYSDMDNKEMQNHYQYYVMCADIELQCALCKDNDASTAYAAAWTDNERQHAFEVRMQARLNVRDKRLIFTRAENKARESYLAYVKYKTNLEKIAQEIQSKYATRARKKLENFLKQPSYRRAGSVDASARTAKIMCMIQPTKVSTSLVCNELGCKNNLTRSSFCANGKCRQHGRERYPRFYCFNCKELYPGKPSGNWSNRRILCRQCEYETPPQSPRSECDGCW